MKRRTFLPLTLSMVVIALWGGWYFMVRTSPLPPPERVVIAGIEGIMSGDDEINATLQGSDLSDAREIILALFTGGLIDEEGQPTRFDFPGGLPVVLSTVETTEDGFRFAGELRGERGTWSITVKGHSPETYTVMVSYHCGNLCAEGLNAYTLRDGGRWILRLSGPRWVS